LRREWNQDDGFYLRLHAPEKVFQQHVPQEETTDRNQKKAYDKETAAECKQALERFLFGTLGAASPVRRIDPKTGKVVAVLDPMAHAKGMRQTEWNRAGLVMLHQYAH
jgi:hypothetical protein